MYIRQIEDEKVLQDVDTYKNVYHTVYYSWMQH